MTTTTSDKVLMDSGMEEGNGRIDGRFHRWTDLEIKGGMMVAEKSRPIGSTFTVVVVVRYMTVYDGY